LGGGLVLPSFSSIQDEEVFVRATFDQLHHLCGSLRLPPFHREKLTLRSVSNLHIADASIISASISGYLHAPVMALGWFVGKMLAASLQVNLELEILPSYSHTLASFLSSSLFLLHRTLLDQRMREEGLVPSSIFFDWSMGACPLTAPKNDMLPEREPGALFLSFGGGVLCSSLQSPTDFTAV
jgi:hypothetical protein